MPMRQALDAVDANSTYILIGLAALTLILLVYSFSLARRVKRLGRRRSSTLSPDSADEIIACIAAQSDAISELGCRLDDVNGRLGNVSAALTHCVQKVGMVRFNAFEDIGGEQSFALVMLDANNNGVAVSSLYGRQDARLYAKPIANGEGERPLSAEERRALENALSGCNSVESLHAPAGR